MQGNIEPGTVPGAFRSVYAGRQSGLLRFSIDKEHAALRFMRGSLVYGQSSNPDMQLGAVMIREGLITTTDLLNASEVMQRAQVRLGEALESLGLADAKILAGALAKHVLGIVTRVLGWTRGLYLFEEQDPDLDHPYDHSLHLSTGQMLVDAVGELTDLDAIRFGLGDQDRVLLASADPLVRFQRVQLTSVDGFVLSRLDGTLTAREIAQLTPLPEEQVERGLLALLCTGIAEYAEPRAAAPPAPPARQTPQFLRQEILDLYASLSDRSHFEMLGVAPDSSDAQVKAAYLSLAKRYHPDVHHGPGLVDLRDRLEAIFFRIGNAYQALQSPAARRQYHEELSASEEPPETGPETGPETAPAPTPPAPAAPGSGPIDPMQVEDVLRQGEERYGEGKYWEAMAILSVAIGQSEGRLQRRARVAVARCFLKYPEKVKEAEQQLRLVIEQDPENAEGHYLLGALYARSGLRARASGMLRRALEIRPKHREAAAALEELDRAGEGGDDAEAGGVLRRLFQRG